MRIVSQKAAARAARQVERVGSQMNSRDPYRAAVARLRYPEVLRDLMAAQGWGELPAASGRNAR